MEKYHVSIIYKDDKKVDISINREDLGKFVDSITTDKIYLQQSEDGGFWTNKEEIRYFLVKKFIEKQKEEQNDVCNDEPKEEPKEENE